MTDHRHTGDDADVPGLEEIHEDSERTESERTSDLLEGLLRADIAKHDDIPTSKSVDDAIDNEAEADDCVEETTTGRWVCRFCETERRNPDGVVAHHATCPDSQHYRDTHWTDDEKPVDERGQEEENEESPAPEAGGETPGEQRTFLVDTQWHEFRAYLKFGEHGLDPYYALHSLMRRIDWSDGPPTRVIEYQDRKYEVTLTFDESKLLPWDDESFRIEKVREFRLHVETADGIRKANFHIRPRWPNLESEEGISTPSNPRDFIGIDVDTQGANHQPGAYPELLDHAMQAFEVNGGANAASDRYLSAPNVEPWSLVIDGEQYVRIDEDYSGPLFGVNGPLERMNLVLAGERSGYRKRVADDQEVAGYYHTATFGSMRARKILAGHQLAKEVKHYHVKHPESLEEDDPLRHPKLGVSYQRSRSDTKVYWNPEALEFDRQADADAIGLNDMARELDEQLLNTLRWAGLPTRPDRQVFVDDAVFTVEPRRRERTLVADPLPELEREQEHMVTRAVTKMCNPERYDTDAKVINRLLADGGETSPKGLAADLGKHYETILRSLERLEDVVEHSYGSVELKSHHLAQRLAERAGDLLGDFGRWQEHVDRLADKAAQFVAGADTDGDSPFDRWVQRYLEGVDDPDGDPRLYLRMGYRPESSQEAREILTDGLSKLRAAFGGKDADASQLARHGQAVVNLTDGTNVHMEFAPTVS
ncbi:hypothetical protein [Natronomonas gomsonensis]|uniref:DUF7845 domain-containing protein n=1 Tax=Natronomonas gomsonensis TaxID=1046043 RepID=UPI0015B8D53D|nr:hypothetical protein [Natronomonas gomsonensis]